MFPVLVPSTSERLISSGVLSWKCPPFMGSYTLIGRSRAADATSLYIPELDILLDCGCIVTHTRPQHVFITHSHSDHFLGITWLLSRKRPPNVYLPLSAVEPMRNFLDRYTILNSGEADDSDRTPLTLAYHLTGVQPDDVLLLGKTIQVRVFDMDHSIPCCGYGFYQRRQKLKKEYQHLSSKELANMRRENRDLVLSEETLFPLFAFMGDTTAVIFEKYSADLFQFPMIIVECSFIDSEQHAERACDVKHVIWEDLQPFVLQHPETIFVLIHFSQQYKSETIREFFRKLNLPNVVPFI